MSNVACLTHRDQPADPFYSCKACTHAYLARMRDEQEQRETLTPAQRDMILKRICRMLGVRFRLRKRLEGSGQADVAANTILIHANVLNVHTLVSVALHEAMHVLVHREGKFAVYHKPHGGRVTRHEAIAYKRTAIPAEIYVDERAERLCRRWFPHIRFDRSYRNERDRQFVRRTQYGWADYHIERGRV